MGHTRALETHAAMLGFWFAPEGIDYLARLCVTAFPDDELFRSGGLLYDKTIKELAAAAPIYVTRPACDLLVEVAPRWHRRFTLRREDIPTPYAWVWLARALPVAADDPEGDWPLRAVSWCSAEMDVRGTGDREPLLSYTFYGDLPRAEPAAATHDLPLLVDSSGWFYGDEQAWLDAPLAERIGATAAFEQCRDRMTRYLATLISALRQRVLVLESEPVRDGDLRRWPDGLLPRPPDVRVVRLPPGEGTADH